MIVAFCMALLTVAALLVWVSAASENRGLIERANTRIFVCTETGRSFPHRWQEGEEEPIESPFTGRPTAWLAEQCYWTRDGRAKRTPTYVVVKERLGLKEKTFCPDCGREVVSHNPMPPEELFRSAE